jgi:hypothetical protein
VSKPAGSDTYSTGAMSAVARVVALKSTSGSCPFTVMATLVRAEGGSPSNTALFETRSVLLVFGAEVLHQLRVG